MPTSHGSLKDLYECCTSTLEHAVKTGNFLWKAFGPMPGCRFRKGATRFCVLLKLLNSSLAYAMGTWGHYRQFIAPQSGSECKCVPLSTPFVRWATRTLTLIRRNSTNKSFRHHSTNQMNAAFDTSAQRNTEPATFAASPLRPA